MKQRLDECTVTLDDGRVFKSIKMQSADTCEKCAFDEFPLDVHCNDIICGGFESEDVYFVEVKNENQ